LVKQVNLSINKSKKSPSNAPVMSYGRAAKMIAVHIKTSEIINNPKSSLAKYAHPPIDSKLMKTIKASCKEECKAYQYTAWTQFDEKSYFQTIKLLRQIQEKEKLSYFWMIEKYWKP